MTGFFFPNFTLGFAQFNDRIFIWRDLVFQSLLELHKRRKAVTEPEARYYMTQLLKGVHYLHKNKVIHRDLKLGNIFLNDDMEVKIGKINSRLVV